MYIYIYIYIYYSYRHIHACARRNAPFLISARPAASQAPGTPACLRCTLGVLSHVCTLGAAAALHEPKLEADFEHSRRAGTRLL